MIHEVMNSVTISADKAAAVQENEDRWAESRIIKQWDHISCHSREVNIINADLILWAARKSVMTHKYVRMKIFILKDFSHHVN